MRLPHSTIRLLDCCLVAGMLWSVSASEALASCGDYLHVKGEPIARHEMPQQHESIGQRSHSLPSPCLNGRCGVPRRTPTPSGTTSETPTRIELRFVSLLDTLVNWREDCALSALVPTDAEIPGSPARDRLDKPPQTTFV